MRLLGITFAFLLSASVVIFLDVPIARELVGIVLVLFLPGFFLARIIGLNDLDTIETALFSIGLSLAFSMFFGLIINEVGPLVGIPGLSYSSFFLIASDIVIAALCILSERKRLPLTLNISIRKRDIVMILGLLGIIFLAAFGSLLVNSSPSNNTVSLVATVAIACLVPITFTFRKLKLSRFYPLIIVAIAVALLLQAALISSHIIGYDIHLEYFVFGLTADTSHWNSGPVAVLDRALSWDVNRMNSMLSVTILPTIFLEVLGMEKTWIYKIIYPLIFSLVPLSIYKIFAKRINKEFAFLSVILVISNFVFYTEMLGLARQMIAELFYVLLLYVILSDRSSLSRNAGILFPVFGAALIVSHYAVAYIFLFQILLLWILPYIFKTITRKVTLAQIVFYLAMCFGWYIFTSGSASFFALTNFASRITGDFVRDFLEPGSRGGQVGELIGTGAINSIYRDLARVLYYVTSVFIVIEVLARVRALMKHMRSEFARDYIYVSLGSLCLLVASVLLPNFATALNMTRIYHISLLILAPFSILGGLRILNFIKKMNVKVYSVIFTLLIILPYFMFNTGFVYEVVGDPPATRPLSLYRMNKFALAGEITPAQDIFGAIWLSEHRNPESLVKADWALTQHLLTSYGMIPRDNMEILDPYVLLENGTYIYLGQHNLVLGKMAGTSFYNMALWNTSQLWNETAVSTYLGNMNKIYSSGEDDIYRTLR